MSLRPQTIRLTILQPSKIVWPIFAIFVILYSTACESPPEQLYVTQGNVTVNYSAPVTDIEAGKTSLHLFKLIGDGAGGSFHLSKGQTYEVRSAFREGTDLESFAPQIRFLTCELEANVFPGQRVDWVMVDPGGAKSGADIDWMTAKILRREVCR